MFFLIFSLIYIWDFSFLYPLQVFIRDFLFFSATPFYKDIN